VYFIIVFEHVEALKALRNDIYVQEICFISISLDQPASELKEEVILNGARLISISIILAICAPGPSASYLLLLK
jgi:hypothetical protein